jgi:hypothetical protein
VEFEAGARVASRHEAFPEAEHLKQFECARLHAQGTGFTCAIQQPIDDPKPDRETLKLCRQRESADELFISLNTVSHHLRNIFAKTGAHNRTEAASFAHQHGFASDRRPAPSAD